MVSIENNRRIETDLCYWQRKVRSEIWIFTYCVKVKAVLLSQRFLFYGKGKYHSPWHAAQSQGTGRDIAPTHSLYAARTGMVISNKPPAALPLEKTG